MDIKVSPKFNKEMIKVHSRDKKLSQKINKQLKIFSQDPRHPSLRTHKLVGSLADSWSISVGRNFRLVYTVTPDGKAYFYKLGTHAEVYQE